MNLVKDNGIYLEMCATSCRQTVTLEDMTTYPYIDFLNKGIKVTINTDDPAIEGTTIVKEYEYMEEVYGLTPEQKKISIENAINAAFTSEAVRKQLRKEFNITK